jgi:hypothetical protein
MIRATTGVTTTSAAALRARSLIMEVSPEQFARAGRTGTRRAGTRGTPGSSKTVRRAHGTLYRHRPELLVAHSHVFFWWLTHQESPPRGEWAIDSALTAQQTQTCWNAKVDVVCES